jgi:Photosynthetic reaction centre cytochrome C subunit
MRVFVGAVALVSCVVVGISAQAQQGPPPAGRAGAPAQGPKNLQVLPKDWSNQQVQAYMRTFTAGLGVQCGYCHVGTPADRALDDKKEKQTARKMITMLMAINDQYLKDVGDPLPAPAAAPAAGAAPAAPGPPAVPPMKVTCYTCHRGTTKPLTVAPVGGGGH